MAGLGTSVVCVTGGTGFIASWLIKRLLEKDYTVRATVRCNPNGGDKDTSYLTNLPGAKERLQIFEANIDKPNSFDKAIEGCTGVFHVAHPNEVTADDEPEEIAIKRQLEATLGILKACLKSKTVKRVVYTSSISTVLYSGNRKEMVDESAWTDLDYYKSLNLPHPSYTAAKIKTEKAALEFSEQHGLELVTLIPALVVGPFLCPKLPRSMRKGLALIMGFKDLYKFLIKMHMVHVDDVARAFIFLLEYPNAKGRYICAAQEIELIKFSEFLSARYPYLQIPAKESLKEVKGYKRSSVSSKKLLDCGFKFKHGLEDIYDDAIQSCKGKGFI